MTDVVSDSKIHRHFANSINSANQIVGSLGVCADDPANHFFQRVLRGKGKTDGQCQHVDHTCFRNSSRDVWNMNNRGEILANGKLPDGSKRVVFWFHLAVTQTDYRRSPHAKRRYLLGPHYIRRKS